ncbi:hypothetical protein [Pseudomonas sp. Q1-7]|uniref:hypothetical protein n=1 Tax=Pseudomonas sp. Q1-7 TaxID=3020843 RepID=UPI002301F785|nr:hypothetical protein [Pseudomonas sp. Q1-7]
MKFLLIGLGVFLAFLLMIGGLVALSLKNAAARNLHGNARFANNQELKAYEYRGPYDS